MHICDALVVCCIDWRFQKYLRQFTDEKMPGKTFDLVGLAGATKNLETIMSQVDISVRLHQIKEIILIHHEDCGAYGTESTLENHARDSRKAREVILARYPDLSVQLYYLHLDGRFELIN